MKILLFSLFAFSVTLYAQTISDWSLGPSIPRAKLNNTTASPATTAVAVTPGKAYSTKKCSLSNIEQEREVPRSMLESLFLVDEDNTNGFHFGPSSDHKTVTVTSAPMVSNCMEMLKFDFIKPDEEHDFYSFVTKVHHSEMNNAVIKKTKEEQEACEKSEDCVCYKTDENSAVRCPFDVEKAHNGSVRKFPGHINTKPYFTVSVGGLRECLVKTEAFDVATKSFNNAPGNSRIVIDNIILDPFPVEETSNVRCRSHKRLHNQSGAFVADNPDITQDACYVYEKCEKEEVNLVSAEDYAEDLKRINQEIAFRKACELNQHDLYTVDPFIEDYLEKFQGLNEEKREELRVSSYEADFKEYLKQLFIDLEKGKLDKVNKDKSEQIKLFVDKVIEPIMDEMQLLAEAIYFMDDNDTVNGMSKDEAIEKLKDLEAKLKKYSSEPFVSVALRDSAKKKGAFNLAYQLQRVILRSKNYEADKLLARAAGPDIQNEIIADELSDYRKILDESIAQKEREDGLRPFDEAMFTAGVEGVKVELQQLSMQESQVTQQLIQNVARECPQMLTQEVGQVFNAQVNTEAGLQSQINQLQTLVKPSVSFYPCQSFDQLVSVKIKTSQEKMKLLKKGQEFTAKAESAKVAHDKAVEDGKAEPVSAYERNRAFQEFLSREMAQANSSYRSSQFSYNYQRNSYFNQPNPYTYNNNMYNTQSFNPYIQAQMYQNMNYYDPNQLYNPYFNGNYNMNMNYMDPYMMYGPMNRFPANNSSPLIYQRSGGGRIWNPLQV